MTQNLLSVDQLTIDVPSPDGRVVAVDDVGFELEEGRIVCLVGESGSGKTLTALALLRLLSYVNARKLSGDIRLAGRDLYAGRESAARRWRGSEVALIPQEPLAALDPLFTIGSQLREVLRAHGTVRNGAGDRERIIEMLADVGIPQPQLRYNDYPHQLSGGMRQRVLIAMALLGSPKLLVADEPTTSLDVTVQAQVLGLIKTAAMERGMSVLLVTHDLGIAAQISDAVMVMYAGKIVESGSTQALLSRPGHPYTEDLISAVPSVEGTRAARLKGVPGQAPRPGAIPEGCTYHPRCRFADDLCRDGRPDLVQEDDRLLRCWHPLSQGGQ